MSIPSLFFNQPEPALPLKAVFTDVGGNFLSFAIAITDMLSVRPKRNSKFILEKLNLGSQEFQESSCEDLSNFIVDFAYTLKLFARDEISANPIYYRQAFKTQDLFQDVKTVSRELIAALAVSLGLAIDIQTKRSQHDLPFSSRFGPINSQAKISLACIAGNYYIPKLFQAERFKMLSIAQEKLSKDLKCQPFIAKQELSLIEDYEFLCSLISIKLETGELKEKNLRSLYIKSFSQKPKSMNFVDSEYGTQNYFEDLVKKDLAETNKHNFELVEAIARAVSLGQIDRAALELRCEENAVLGF